MSWWRQPEPEPEPIYEATYWRLEVYFAHHGKHINSFALRNDDREQIELWATDIQSRMSSAVHGPVYELKVSDDYTEIINCKLVQRVTVESRTENRRVSDDVVVWRLPF